ncbi:MAG: histidine kinase, partial [Actinomycetota bacterium]|nr:histidine kinase [Actinomycetota bacterium]
MRASPRLVALTMLALYVVAVAAGILMHASEPTSGIDVAEGLAILLGFSGFPLVGALVVARRPGNTIGWLFLAIGALFALGLVAQTYAESVLPATGDPAAPAVAAALVENTYWYPLLGLVFVYTPLLFPDGRLPSPWWRPVAWVAGVDLVVTTVLAALGERLAGQGDTYNIANPIGVPGLVSFEELPLAGPMWFVLIASNLCALASLVVRYRRSGGDERQQLKWFVYGAALLICLIVAEETVSSILGSGGLPFGNVLFGLVIGCPPAAAGVAILRYRLYDIDVVISKTVVFAGLAGFITVVYVGIVVGVGNLVGSGGEPNLGLSVVATAVVAVAFGPVRERVQRVANRLVYGVRATPYEVLSSFSARLGETVGSDELLVRMARLLAGGTGAARARVWLRVGSQVRPAAAWPDDHDQPAPLGLTDARTLPALPGVDAVAPVVHHGQLLGALTVAKARGETLTPTDQALIGDLAAQAGLVLRNVRLTAELLQRVDELRASRQRLVAAQDTERRRLERDLHDGAQQQLVALKVKLALARTMAEREDATKAAQVLGALAGDADDAITTLRDLARGIYPPLLAAEG